MFKQWILSAAIVCAGIVLFAAENTDLEEIIGEKYEIFKADRPRFINNSNKRLFRWTSDEKTSARYPAWKNSPKVEYFGQKVQEVILRFKENALDTVYVSVYNRGDAGDITQEDFMEIIKGLSGKLDEKTGDSAPAMLKGKLNSNTTVYARVWKHKDFTYTMKWSASGRKKSLKPEYIQIEVEKYNPKDDAKKRKVGGVNRAEVKKSDSLISNVKNDDKGNLFIDNIPMVDQGQKGYCAVAVIERIMRYYGMDVNQHALAQIAQSNAERGTNANVMVEALKKAGVKLGIKVKERYSIQAFKSADDFEKMIQGYNNAAKKMKKPRVQMIVKNNMIYIGETMEKFNPDVYVKYRNNDKKGLNAFRRDILSRVKQGLPIAWSVQLGWVPEDKLNPQVSGGHMRLIIGFNEKNNEVIYSDTWGQGHEKKVMPLEDAWTITTKTVYVDPRASAR